MRRDGARDLAGRLLSRAALSRAARLVRRICAVSGKRGGYGAYVPLLRLIDADPELELLILLADMHASPESAEPATR